MKTLLEYFDKKMLPANEQKLVVIMHADAYEDAQLLEKTVKDKYNLEYTEIIDVGPVIGSHVGAGMVAIIFLAKDKIEPNDKSMTE